MPTFTTASSSRHPNGKEIRMGTMPNMQKQDPNKLREDTELRNFPLYCPKCRQETLIDAKCLTVTISKEPDA